MITINMPCERILAKKHKIVPMKSYVETRSSAGEDKT